MSEETIIRELIDMVVLDRQLEDDLKSMLLYKRERNRILQTRRMLDDTRIRFLKILNSEK